MYQISVVIPVFNKCATLERACISVILQKNVAVEIIVVDDGSTDDSINLLPFQIRKSIRVIQQNNGGVSSARNLGAASSISPLIAFLDADDEFLPGALEVFCELAIKYQDASFFSGTFDIVSENGVRYDPQGVWASDRVEIVKNFTGEYLVNTTLVSSSSTCIRRVAFESTGGFPEGVAIGEDVYLWLKLAESGRLCHSGQLISRVYRNAGKRSLETSADIGQVPYFLSYYLLNDKGYSRYRSDSSLRRLLYWLAFKTLLGAKEAGSIRLMVDILKLFTHKDLFIGILFFVVSKMPVRIIKIFRSLRQTNKENVNY
jgi:glycosyltransferase involved in cell wall biosynthesis